MNYVLFVVALNDLVHFDGAQQRHRTGQNVAADARIDEPLSFVVGQRFPEHARIAFVQRSTEETQVIADLSMGTKFIPH